MKLPRDVSGRELVQVLQKLGYEVNRQKGSHIRLVCQTPSGNRPIVVPDHAALKVGTLARILNDVAGHLEIDRDEIVKILPS